MDDYMAVMSFRLLFSYQWWYAALGDDKTVAAVLKAAASDLVVKNLEALSLAVVEASTALAGHRQ